MNPKIIGSRYDIVNGTEVLFSRKMRDFHKQIPVVSTWSPQERQATDLENARRARAQEIQQAVTRITNADNQRQQRWDSLSSSSSVSSIVLVPSTPPCPRYEEIGDYLVRNRAQGRFCLGTMNFRMPENTMLNHILLLGGITLSTEEWRDFLMVANEKQELFR